MRVTNIHFTSAMPYAKRNDLTACVKSTTLLILSTINWLIHLDKISTMCEGNLSLSSKAKTKFLD